MHEGKGERGEREKENTSKNVKEIILKITSTPNHTIYIYNISETPWQPWVVSGNSSNNVLFAS